MNLRKGASLLPAFLLALCAPVAGLEPGISVSQYIHRSWTRNDIGPLPAIMAVAQTPDGYLWLGTRHGLLRFDGVRFTRFLPANGRQYAEEGVRALASGPDSRLWIASTGGLRIASAGRLIEYKTLSELQNGAVTSLQFDAGGRLWMSGMQNGVPVLAVLDGSGIRKMDSPPAFFSLSARSDGGIWAVGAREIYDCRADGGIPRCRAAGPKIGGNELPCGLSPTRGLLTDRNGNLWIATQLCGLYVFANGQMTREERISGDSVTAILEDREGNMWAAGNNSLDQFRVPKVVRWSTDEHLPGNFINAVFGGRSGDPWLAAANGGLGRLHRGRYESVLPSPGPDRREVLSILEDRDSTLWAGTTKGVIRLAGTRLVDVPSPAARPFHAVLAIAQSSGGTIWLADAKQGLARIENGVITAADLPIPPNTIYQLAADRKGNVWVGYYRGGVSEITAGHVRNFDEHDGLAPGAVQAIFEDSHGDTWFGTRRGLSRYHDGAWTTWTEREGIPYDGVEGVLEDASGRLWLLTCSGIAVTAMPPLAARPSPLALTVYGPSDDIRPKEIPGYANPRMTLTPDGNIWIATANGLAGLQPSSIRNTGDFPPVVIEEVTVDGKQVDVPAGDLDVRGKSIALVYTALSLGLPEAIRFRYRLDPIDRDWADVGTTRRTAFEALAPGHYRFRLTARNTEGYWNPAPATLTFIIEPRFYQTLLFKVFCCVIACLLIYGAHRLRVRNIRNRFKVVLQERTRLARELHDTLLQGFTGVVYQLDAAGRQLETEPDEGRTRLNRALEQADRSLREARQTLSSMRLSEVESQTLPEAVRKAGHQNTEGTAIRFEFEVKGEVRELPYDIQANLYIIGREAIWNAVNHARPNRILASLFYTRTSVALCVEDTGIGFDAATALAKDDHWGLAGMTERANRIGGTLSIRSAPGAGTTIAVEVSLPRYKKAHSNGS